MRTVYLKIIGFNVVILEGLWHFSYTDIIFLSFVLMDVDLRQVTEV